MWHCVKRSNLNVTTGALLARVQVATLFAAHDDLLEEFTFFLPDSKAPHRAAMERQRLLREQRAAADAAPRWRPLVTHTEARPPLASLPVPRLHAMRWRGSCCGRCVSGAPPLMRRRARYASASRTQCAVVHLSRAPATG
jgi:histone deacetylase complex regulatory component SIN3